MADELERIPEDLREQYQDINAYKRISNRNIRSLIQRIADLQAKLEEKERQRKEFEEKFIDHIQHVSRFLTEMYQIMVDPIEDPGPDMKIAEMCTLLRRAASDNRQALQDQMDRAGNLPANWKEDSSLETWFPLTAEELQRLRTENERLKALIESADNPGGSLMWTSDHDKILSRELAALKNTVPPVIQMEAYAFWGDPEDNLTPKRSEAARILEGAAILLDPIVQKVTKERDELHTEKAALQAELEQEREDARRIIGLRQDRIDALTAELGNVRTQWNRMRIAKERAEAKNAALEARLETLTKPVTDEETASWDDETLRDYRGEFDRILSPRSQQAPRTQEGTETK